jgi:Cu-Zn family superoxide dismutase
MSISSKLVVIGLGVVLLPACAGINGPTIYQDPSAIAVLSPSHGSSVYGVVTFVRSGDVVLVNANLTGFKPNSSHGIHIQESGDCITPNLSSNLTLAESGGANVAMQYKSDLGNVTADSKGDVYTSFEVGEGAFGTGSDSIIGRGLVVRAEKDDLKSQSAGNSGAHSACGLITRNPDRRTYSTAGQS